MMRMVAVPGADAPRRLAELGVGTGGFLEAVARRGIWPEAELVGCDRSAARIAVAGETLRSLGRGARLCAGVNALDAGDSFYREVAAAGSADVVVLSQFEHYAPNDRGSALAARLAREGRPFGTKAEVRRLAHSRLRPGGWLFVIDDYKADTPEEQDAWDRAWDAHVVAQWARPDVIAGLRAVDPVWAARLARHYDPARPWEERLRLAARARARRRRRDGEELQSLAAACGDFHALFDGGAHGLLPHPQAASHPQFFLHWGRAAGAEAGAESGPRPG